MVRTKNPAHHFDTLTTLSSVAGDSVPLDESYASTPLRPSPRSNFSSASRGGRPFLHLAAKKPLIKKSSRAPSKRYRPGARALREIRHFQKTTDRLIPAAPFMRLVREIANECSFIKDGVRFQSEAVKALQESAEAFLVMIFEQANFLALHGRRVTVMPRDIQLWRLIKEF
ncbi:unnamed protein product [Enterobius vermicularis]|uniref:Histone domain-containing protein n=1 Tax=Enterobius vermicularis TaxID=51028 RepID=A0A0N4UXC6_ENTVE|nr:unnamed protein product [Enterobius vermicularis]